MTSATPAPAVPADPALLPPLLASIREPADLRSLSDSQVRDLAEEIRSYLVASVARTGGHLGPNLGVVELTLAMHRVFDSPRDTFIFDTGHQSYVHKLLTGRQDFSHLRERGGVSGYPSRSESVHDVVENSHASTALSWADGIARAYRLRGEERRHVVAVIGDGAMTGGMAWEALDNIADSDDQHLIIIVNDNGRSYAPTIGGLAHHLDALRTNPGYERTLSNIKHVLLSQGAPGRAAYEALHGLKRGLKDALVPSAFFEDLGIKYTGPIDGHDAAAVESALRLARDYRDPVIVHVMTEKGRGYTPAEEDPADRFHAVGRIHPETGLPVVASRFGWTSVFAQEVLDAARATPSLVAITAAMQAPVGLQPMAEEMPERVIDVGIAEQHALTAAAGMAFGGLHPVVALYATFLNRAFDQLLMDVAMHKAGVSVVLDRAGITGTDGASHNGMWDLAMLGMIPGAHVAAPRDEASLRAALRRSFATDDAVTVVRYPKGSLPAPVECVSSSGEGFEQVDLLCDTWGDAHGVAAGQGSAADREQRAADRGDARGSACSQGASEAPRLLMVAVGAMVPQVMEAARSAVAAGHAVRVAYAPWIIPAPQALVEMACQADLVMTVEDGLADGGAGSQLHASMEAFQPVGERLPRVCRVGLPRQFVHTATREQIMADSGMDAAGLRALLAAHGWD